MPTVGPFGNILKNKKILNKETEAHYWNQIFLYKNSCHWYSIKIQQICMCRHAYWSWKILTQYRVKTTVHGLTLSSFKNDLFCRNFQSVVFLFLKHQIFLWRLPGNDSVIFPYGVATAITRKWICKWIIPKSSNVQDKELLIYIFFSSV